MGSTDKTIKKTRALRTKILLITVVIILFIIVSTLLTLQCYFPRPIAVQDIKVSRSDTTLIKRGAYLVNNVAACNQCHAPRDWGTFSAPVIAGREGEGEYTPGVEELPGKFYPSNITPHNLGNWSDGEIYRVLTSGITKDGDPLFQFMPYDAYGKMTTNDVKAVIAYLRTMTSINKESHESKIDFPLNLIMRTFDRKPNPTAPEVIKTEVQRGGYLVSIAECRACHTPMNKGQFIDSLRFSGTKEFVLPTGGHVYSANLTPHESGLKSWTEEAFVARFKAHKDRNSLGKVEKNGYNTPMPWSMYAQMDEKDLKAIFKYLKTLKPINTSGKPRFTPNI
jgi:mono/diheme cytochrome c family protein